MWISQSELEDEETLEMINKLNLSEQNSEIEENFSPTHQKNIKVL